MPFFAYQDPVFQPATRIITAITQANPALVTTSFDHNYSNGQIIRLHIPEIFGMEQAHLKFAPILVTGDTTFTIALDTRLFNPFIVPVQARDYITALAVPIGELATQVSAPVRNVL
jgi:hypothetical protein